VHDGVRVPLNIDAYTLLVLAAPGALLAPTFGTLDSAGQGTARFVVPTGLPPALAGLRLDHAYVVVGTRAELASNAVPVRLVR
jgi:hypothetical protein